MKKLLLFVAAMVMSLGAMADPVLLYSTGFETENGFTATTTYNKTVNQGPVGQQWNMLGTATTNDKKTGNQSLQMRVYSGQTSKPFAYTLFDLGEITSLSFYFRAEDLNVINSLNVQYGDGTSWTTAATIVPENTSWAQYTVNIPSAATDAKRIKFEVNYTVGSNTKKCSLDDINVYGNPIAAVVDPSFVTNNASVATGSQLNLSTLFECNSTGAITYSVTASPENGDAVVSGSNFTATVAGEYTITAEVAAVEGQFNAGSATAKVTVVATHVVTIATVENGSISVKIASDDVASGSSVMEGAKLAITAIPAEGYKVEKIIVHYTSNGEERQYIKNGDTYTWTLGNSDISIEAEFAAEVFHTLTLTQPAEGGTIAATIDNEAAGASVAEGATVTLKALAAEGYEFAGWTVTGAAVAAEDNATTTFVMGSEDVSVTAAFRVSTTVRPDYVITFNEYNSTSGDSSTKLTGTSESDLATGADIVSSISSISNVYPARTGCGVKFGTSKAGGSMVINFEEALNVESIVFSAALYSASEGADGFKVYINDETTATTYTLSAGVREFETKTLTLDPAVEVTKIKIETAVAKRLYLNGISIYLVQEEPADPTTPFEEAWNAIDENEEMEVEFYGYVSAMDGDTDDLQDGSINWDVVENPLEATPSGAMKRVAAAEAQKVIRVFTPAMLNTPGNEPGIGDRVLVTGTTGANGINDGTIKGIDEKGWATSVENASVEKAQKLFIDGQIVIVKDGVRYNAIGQKM